MQALITLVERLPSTLPAAVLVAMHTSTTSNGVLPQILARAGELPVKFAVDGEALQSGRIYVAHPDYHLLATADGLRVLHGPRESGFRPAIDPLFRSAARVYGSRVIGVILSGALSDGVYGLNVIKQHRGVAIVQDPDEAIIPSMPRSALQMVSVDHVLPALAIGEMIEQLSQRTAEREADMADAGEHEPQLPSEETQVSEMEDRYGSASSLTCPDCGGALWEVQDGRVIRYQCHVGHQYSPDGLDEGQRDAVESALWSAVRVLEEHVELKTRMARRAAGNGLSVVAESFHQSAAEAHRQAQSIRALLFGRAGAAPAGAKSAPPLENGGPATPKKKRAARGRSKKPRQAAAATRQPAARKAARPKGRTR